MVKFRLAKKKRSHKTDDYIPDPFNGSVSRRKEIAVPADNEPDAYRFTAKIRQGRISGEVFCKNPERRKELGLSPIIVDNY